MRKAFTLVEMLISVAILSILMLFIYKSYTTLNKSNALLSTKVSKQEQFQKIKLTLYLDLLNAKKNSLSILNQDKQNDVVFLQTSHSLYKRFEPYVAYISKNHHLYRVESLQKFERYPLPSQNNFTGEDLGVVQIFRLYPKENKKNNIFLVHLQRTKQEEIILKVPLLNALF